MGAKPEVRVVTAARRRATNRPAPMLSDGHSGMSGRAWKGLFLLTAVLLAGVLALLVAVWPKGGGAGGATAGSSPAGWRQIWRDDFNGPARNSPDKTNWIMEKGYRYPNGPDHWGTGEIQHYNDLPEDVSTDGKGHLLINPHTDIHNTWESARIETRRSDFRPPSGGVLRAEARIQLPAVTGTAALGYWPAFWMLGAGIRDDTKKWPSHGEFDILENVNGDQKVQGTLHCGVEKGGPCNEHNGLSQQTTCPGSPCPGAFHTYAFEWDLSSSQQLRWYVDGQLYHTVNASQMDAKTWAEATHGSMTIILNVAMGGDFPNAVNGGKPTPTADTKSGYPMVVDYVSVSTRG